MKIVIIGGVAAGTKAAAKLKRENRDYEVLILTKSKDISYAGCGLPYYVGEVIQNREQLIVNTPESFSKLTGAEVRTRTEVTAVNRATKTVTAVDLESGISSEYSYDKLIIATGADPIKPPIEGVDLPGVYTMRTPDDAIMLRNAVDEGKLKRAAVIGGGYIGLEIAENLSQMGVRVSVIEMLPHVLQPGFDPEMAEYVESKMADAGVMAFTGTRLVGIEGDGKVEKIRTQKRTMKADAVILSVGIRPNTAFLADSGLELMPNKTVKVNAYMQTNDEDIYAVGDCACVSNAQTHSSAWSPMGSSANIEGRLVAKAIAGDKREYRGVLGTAVAKLAGVNIARTGLTEAQAKEAGYDAVSVVTVVDDKAHYYPGASSFVVKMIADKTTLKLLGIQVIGTGAVDKMADIAVTAITMGATLHDVEDMDLAYAPPFSTAIHPFTHTVNVLLNKISGVFETFTPAQYLEGAAEGYRLVDLSLQPAIEGAPYVDLTSITDKMEGFEDKNEKLLLVCTKGKRAYMAQNRLKHCGYTNTKVLEGGTTVNEVEA
ncbi:MAG TPA: FAD-dependent oxidoreductase [Firmicutes bacterium]|nr:FAD-dependent oxidoreductase [Bacillota bacterium]